MSKATTKNGGARDSYFEMVKKFPLASIRDRRHLRDAQAVLDMLLGREPLDDGEEMYLDAISDLIEHYEEKHAHIKAPTDADMLRHLMDAKGVRQKDVVEETGIPKSTVSQILSGERPLTRGHIERLARYFNVSRASFPERGDDSED